jgi:hypothetical protein
MCPLRFILVFFSAVLAGYFAWRTVRSSPNIDLDSDSYIEEEKSSLKKEDFDFKKVYPSKSFFFSMAHNFFTISFF